MLLNFARTLFLATASGWQRPDTLFISALQGSKAPVEHFTRAAAKEFQPRGISVVAIGPGKP